MCCHDARLQILAFVSWHFLSLHTRNYVAEPVLLVDDCITSPTQCTAWDLDVASVCTNASNYLGVCAHMLSSCEFVRNSSTTPQAQFLEFSISLSRDSNHCGAAKSKQCLCLMQAARTVDYGCDALGERDLGSAT